MSRLTPLMTARNLDDSGEKGVGSLGYAFKPYLQNGEGSYMFIAELCSFRYALDSGLGGSDSNCFHPSGGEGIEP